MPYLIKCHNVLEPGVMKWNWLPATMEIIPDSYLELRCCARLPFFHKFKISRLRRRAQDRLFCPCIWNRREHLGPCCWYRPLCHIKDRVRGFKGSVNRRQLCMTTTGQDVEGKNDDKRRGIKVIGKCQMAKGKQNKSWKLIVISNGPQAGDLKDFSLRSR